MKNPVKFIEIPAADFARAVRFYEAVLNIRLTICDGCETEKMAFFGDFTEEPNVAISWSADFHPSKDGVLVSLTVEDVDAVLALVAAHGGKTVRGKTKIEADGMGFFAQFSDSEGNTLGLYSGK